MEDVVKRKEEKKDYISLVMIKKEGGYRCLRNQENKRN
tara:strand:- start:16 stop:129 length:114 start_codon:yes stop_codon:yes gene_type:complete